MRREGKEVVATHRGQPVPSPILLEGLGRTHLSVICQAAPALLISRTRGRAEPVCPTTRTATGWPLGNPLLYMDVGTIWLAASSNKQAIDDWLREMLKNGLGERIMFGTARDSLTVAAKKWC